MPPEEDFSDDESYYVPAGTSPPRVVRGPSVRDMQLYGSENRDLLRARSASVSSRCARSGRITRV